MRWTLALVAALVLAGCSSKGDDPAPDVGIPATALDSLNVTQTVFPLLFPGGTREGSLPISETFAPNDACFFGFPDCVGASVRSYDLTPVVPAEVPVEMSIDITTDADLDINFELVDAQFVQASDDDEDGGGGGGGGGGGERIDAVVVRSQTGSVTMTIRYGFPSPDSAQGLTVEGLVHTVTRADVVPALLPVAIQLGPGDVVNATGDGLEHFAAFPPSGEALRAVQSPFSITIPENGPSGTWFLVGAADEALKLTGPNRTLSARLLEFIETDPVDIPANQATTFTMDVPGHPLLVGVVLQSKAMPVGFFGGAAVTGPHEVSLRSPGNVEVLGAQVTCSPLPWCDFSFIGGSATDYDSGFLNEHLTTGAYTATVAIETANDIQAFGFAVAIKQT